jgi:uncharacterized protein YyaL (SSP411 family)
LSSNLENQVSIYLNRYKSSPIKWHSWGKEAFSRAKREKKPIFLSIGYSTSYLCELMREESFNNSDIAKILNENFISIKVDRDERSDVDNYFKQVYRLMNGQNCSSPISIFMSEDREPFYSAGYIAPYPKGNVLGFYELLTIIKDKYQNDKATLVDKGKEILSFLNPQTKPIEATKLDKNILNTIIKHYNEVYDRDNGGFGDEPKFLNSSLLDLLLDSYIISKDKTLLNMLSNTLEKMANGKIFDKARGGFFVYANRKNWDLPRREKLSYDNANIASVYLRSYLITGNTYYKDIGFSIIDFLLESMSNGTLFYSNSTINKDETIFIDTKIITSWNAMVIDALFLASTIDENYTPIAINSIDTLLERFYIDGELYHTDNIEAFLEDYAYFGVALFSAYQKTNNQEYLILSQTLLNKAIERFYQYGRWRFSNNEFFVGYGDIYDLTYPSAVATILYLIEKISPLIEGEYGDFLFKTLEINSYNLMRQPLSTPKMTKVLLLYLKDDIISKKNS